MHPSLMSTTTAVIIVRPEHLVSVKKRLSTAEHLAVFSEADLLSVQDTILANPPDLLIMQTAFAATSRGASLVTALKSGAREHGTAVRVLIEDEVKSPLLLSHTELTPGDAILETSRPLDRAGTRQAARYPMNRRDIVVNGQPGQLIDLSVSGAQVQVAARLRPMKVVRLAVTGRTGDIRLQGTVAWAIAMQSGSLIHYRAGIEFVSPNQKWLSAYCAAYGDAPDPTLHS